MITGLFLLVLMGIKLCSLSDTRGTQIDLPVEKSYDYTDTSEVVMTPELNTENVYQEILKDSIEHPDIVMKQAILESGWFTSDLSVKNNNIFGFRSKNWLFFTDWTECIKYYKSWQDKHYKGGDYYNFLEKINYAEDDTYVKILKRVKYDR